MKRTHSSQHTPLSESVVEGSLTHISVQPCKKRRRYWPPLSLFSVLLLAGVWNVSLGLQATIHLIPVAVSRTIPIPVVAALRATSGQSQTHLLSAHTELIVVATVSGSQHLPASTASGALTWYNATATGQVVPAHTSVTTATGQKIETDSAFVIPPAAPPLPGQITETAHAAVPGAQGNIAAFSLRNSACACAQGITVSNVQAFAGGQDERLMAVVRQHDIDAALSVQRAQLEHVTRQALRQQAAGSEQVVGPSCTLTASSDHPVASLLPLGSRIRITLRSTCSGIAYNQPDVQRIALAAFARATHPAGTYRLFKPVSRIEAVGAGAGGILTITVRVSGLWVYQISASTSNILRRKVVGTTRNEAEQVLAHYPGIHQATIECWWPWLPADPARIHLEA